MLLKSFGCSFIWGVELSDCCIDVSNPSNKTWPALVAQQQGWQYQCCATPGHGNLAILDKVLCELTQDPSAFYIINWTYLDRFDYVDCNHNTWQTLLPNDRTPLANVYYRDIHSEYRDKFNSLIAVHTALSALLQKHAQFSMTFMDHLIFDSRWNASAGMLMLQKEIVAHANSFENQSFLDWSKAQKFPIGVGNHPLDQAHARAAEYAAAHHLNRKKK